MAKYFVYDNANRKIRVGDHSFVFTVVENVGGSWRGVLSLEDPAQIEALTTVAARLGIREVSEEDFQAFSKKKKTYFGPSAPSNLVPQAPSHLRGPSAAVVVSEGKPASSGNKPAVAVSEKIEDLVEIKVAPYTDPLDEKYAPKTRKRKASTT